MSADAAITIDIEMEGPGKYQPGIAVVKINGKEHAYLRTQEAFRIEIAQPEFSTITFNPPLP